MIEVTRKTLRVGNWKRKSVHARKGDRTFCTQYTDHSVARMMVSNDPTLIDCKNCEKAMPVRASVEAAYK